MPTKAKKIDGKKVSLADTLAALRKDGTRIGFEEHNAEPKFYTSDNMVIDALSGGQGIPAGKIVEFAGPPASGKTTTAVSAAKNVIAEGGVVAFFDYERAIDKPYFRSLGVEPDDEEHFLYFTPRTLEDGANIFRKLVATGEVKMGIFDSVAAMVTAEELEAETGKVTVATRAKMLHQFLRQVKDLLADNDCTLIFLNQLLEVVDITWAGQQRAARGIKEYTSAGGKGIPFYASLRLRFEPAGDLIREDLIDPLTNELSKTKIGSKHKISVIKNKVGKPGGSAEVINVYGQGFSQIRTAIEILETQGAVKKSNSWFSFKDPALVQVFGDKQIQGKDKLVDYITNSNAECRGTVISLARDLLSAAIAEQEITTAVIEDYESAELPEEFAGQSGVFGG